MKSDASWLCGSFADPNFPELLVQLQRTGKTGVLYTAYDRVKKKIYFQDGVPTGTRSNIKSELIGEMLVAKGVISREHQRFALEVQKERKISFGAVLVEGGVLSADELFVQARRQFLTALFSLFGVRRGNYKFEECELPPEGYYYEVAFSNMLVFGIRQIVNLDTLEAMVGDRSQIPTPGSQFLDYSKIMFTVKELSVTNQVDGSKTIDEIIRASDVEPITVFKTLLILMHHDFIHFEIDIPEDEGEEIIELEASAKAALGYEEYDPANPIEEQAVAGSDFKVSPEGIHPTTGALADTAAPADAGKAPEPGGSEEKALPEAAPPTPQAPQEAGVIDLDAENLDEVLSTFHGGAAVDATSSSRADALSAEDAPEEESLPEAGALSLDALLDRETESVSGPVASASRTQQPEEEDVSGFEGLSGEVAESLPQFDEENERDDRLMGDPHQAWSKSAFEVDDDEPKAALSPDAPQPTLAVEPESVEAKPLPGLDDEDAVGIDSETAVGWDAPSEDAGGTPDFPEPADGQHEVEAVAVKPEVSAPSPFLADPGSPSDADKVLAALEPDAQVAVREMSAASGRSASPKRSRSLFFAALVVLAIGAGAFAWTPWRTEFQDWVLARLDRTNAGVTPPAATPAVEIPVPPAPLMAEESVSNAEAIAVPAGAVPATADDGQRDPAVTAAGVALEKSAATEPPEVTTASEDLTDTGGAQEDAELQGVPSENPTLAAAIALYPLEDWWARMKAWTARVRELPRSKFTIQVEISENIDFVWEDLNQLVPKYDAMVLRYRIKDWTAYTLIVGIYDSRAQGMDALQTLPPEILRLGPLVKTMATIQKGLVEPVAKP
jgi:septal ring-binding cell division protein DamX